MDLQNKLIDIQSKLISSFKMELQWANADRKKHSANTINQMKAHWRINSISLMSDLNNLKAEIQKEQSKFFESCM
jgi:hypothetical protein